MNQQPQIQKPKKKLSKGFIVTIILILVVIFGWAGLTKAGFIPNYLDIEFLYPKQDELNIPYFPIDGGEPGMYMYDAKPVIYLYPERQQNTEVKLNYSGNLIVSYPEYKNGWQVTAYPDGKIINMDDGKEYSYLFWEGDDKNANYDLSTGFIVEGSETVKFLQDKLSKLGLTPKEYNEFIVYWSPLMQNNNFNLIHFATKQEYDNRAVLDITPKPDSMLRVFMVFKGLEDNNVKIQPQELKSFNRNGFVLVEWGGTEIK
ncbi:MAG TPA: hypothetical protein PLK76_04055 [bacterium]|nr:hypothetical protein [bacterium]